MLGDTGGVFTRCWVTTKRYGGVESNSAIETRNKRVTRKLDHLVEMARPNHSAAGGTSILLLQQLSWQKNGNRKLRRSKKLMCLDWHHCSQSDNNKGKHSTNTSKSDYIDRQASRTIHNRHVADEKTIHSPRTSRPWRAHSVIGHYLLLINWYNLICLS